MRRYAIYYVPRLDEPVARFARHWLGRDPESGDSCSQPVIAAISPVRLWDLTAEPRRYGFHGTMKPPFVLAGGTEQDLLAAAERFASAQQPFEIPHLMLKAISGFLALVPSAPCPQLNALASDCVRSFDWFRAPPSETELARRRKGGLSARQDELLQLWGYPYVFDEFRFHLTLTGRLDEPERSSVYAVLQKLTKPYCRDPLPIRDIAVFRQDDGDEPFRVIARFRFSGG